MINKGIDRCGHASRQSIETASPAKMRGEVKGGGYVLFSFIGIHPFSCFFITLAVIKGGTACKHCSHSGDIVLLFICHFCFSGVHGRDLLAVVQCWAGVGAVMT